MTGDRTPGQGARAEARRLAPGAAAPAGEFTYCVVAPPPRPGARVVAKVPDKPTNKPGADRRAGRRVPTRLHEGTISPGLAGPGAAGPDAPLVHCRIRDRSGGGARLHLEHDRPLPRAFVLTDVALDKRFRVTLVWQSGREAGVRLVPLRP